MELYVIAGPNGAGKTTFAREFLPNYADCKNFVNADLIAQGMAPFSPESAALRAGRLMLSEINSFARRKVSFGFETTLSGRSYLGLFRGLKARGYEIHILILMAQERGSCSIQSTRPGFERRTQHHRTSDSSPV
jgi:predicted ABC-type ATPase